MTPTRAIFDMGSVLIGWELRPVYGEFFSSDPELEEFLRGPFRTIYDAVHDGRGSIAECVAPIRTERPEWNHLIDVYEHRWGDFITEVMTDTVRIARELHAGGVPLYGLSNWPEQAWPPQKLRTDLATELDFLELFEDIWVSGEHKLRKPDPLAYKSALQRFDVAPGEAVFIDDLDENVAAANQLGLHGLLFTDAPTLRRDLEAIGLLGAERGSS
ncbi:MAG: HAD-IA family hydrolase [Acidobacteriota bacterium]